MAVDVLAALSLFWPRPPNRALGPPDVGAAGVFCAWPKLRPPLGWVGAVPVEAAGPLLPKSPEAVLALLAGGCELALAGAPGREKAGLLAGALEAFVLLPTAPKRGFCAPGADAAGALSAGCPKLNLGSSCGGGPAGVVLKLSGLALFCCGVLVPLSSGDEAAGDPRFWKRPPAGVGGGL